MKIAIFVDQLICHGGIEKLVALKANYWSKKFNYDVSIVSTENKGQPSIYEVDRKVKSVDLSINYNRSKSFFSVSNLWLLFLNIVRVQKYILKEKPDKIIVASHIPLTYVLPFLYLGSAKIIKEFHFTKYFISQKRGLKVRLLNFIEKKYDFRVVLSTEERSFYTGNNIIVIANPVIKEASINIVDLTEKELLAVSVMRFAPVKRVGLMIDIWEKFIKLQPNWKLKIFAPFDNKYAYELKNEVEKKNLGTHILFEGDTNEVAQEVAKARVFLMTSEQECFPMTVLEANSVGVPVIAFDCPTGPRNIINDKKDGFLVTNDKIDNFISVLEIFSNDVILQGTLSTNAFKNAMNYSLEKVMDEWKTKILLR